MLKRTERLAAGVLLAMLGACSSSDDNQRINSNVTRTIQTDLTQLIESAADGGGLTAFTLPASDDFQAIPQDPNNPITAEKVALGRMLFHDTAISTGGVANEGGSWSCATCHHAAAGFKSGIPQGIGEGGIGFGADGSQRVLDDSFDANADDGAANKPDLQPLTSPTVLNTAYQDVMLWNGQFGNAVNSSVNAGIADDILMTPDTPKAENSRFLAGLEIQAIAGLKVHRLEVEPDTVVQTDAYKSLWQAAYPTPSMDVREDAGKAIAAYERTVLANRSPFQRWLRGDENAMAETEMRGAKLFFGKADCVACHRGPGLSSEAGASADQLFHAVGFADFDTSDPRVHGNVEEAVSKGRGGFTNNAQDDFKFKIPQLYNLADTTVFGHGASFDSIRAVVEYKNAGIPQNPLAQASLDPRFVALGLSDNEVDDLTAFLTNALRDPDLARYVPAAVPSGACVTVDAFDAIADIRCTGTAINAQ